jgi:UDP-glucuronate decarboxylase
MRHDVTFPLYVEVDEIYNLACPGLADPLPARPGADHQDQRPRRDQHARAGQAPRPRSSRPPPARSTATRPSSAAEDYWGNVNPIGPRSCYDEGKRCAETLFFDYRRQHGSNIKVARIFNTYGPRMHPNDGRVVSNFIVQALKGEPITLYGDGSQTRSFCYVDDLIDGFPSSRSASWRKKQSRCARSS